MSGRLLACPSLLRHKRTAAGAKCLEQRIYLPSVGRFCHSVVCLDAKVKYTESTVAGATLALW